MYSVPTFAKNALDGTSKYITHYGLIETTDGTQIQFFAKDIVGGSAVLNKKVSSRNSIDIGTVYASQLDVRLVLPGVSRYSLFGAKIWLYANIMESLNAPDTWASISGLKWSSISNRTWASFGQECEIPLGVFTIASAEQGVGSIQIRAYDDMLKFDAMYAPDATARTPYNWVVLLCNGCGVSLGSTKSQIQQLANGSRSMAFKPNVPGVAIKSYRDCLSYLCEALCCVAYIDRSGLLRLEKYKTSTAKTIGAGRRYTSSLSDFVCYYTGLYATNASTAIAEYYSNTSYTGEDDGLVLEIGVNPLLQIDNDTQRRAACQAIIDSLSSVHYVPYSVTLPAHPEFDVLDVLKFTGNQAGSNDIGGITDITYTVNGATKISCSGGNPKLLGVVSRADKTISSLVDIVKDIDDSITEVTSDYQQAIEDATKAITGNVGGFVVIRNNQTGTPTNPDEILILDSASQGQISAATNVWRWNASGFGFSHNGYNGDYTTAIYWDSATGAPKIAADYITVGYLSSERVKIGSETLTTTMGGVQTDITELQVDLSGFRTTVSQTYETKADAETKLSTVRSEINQTAESITLSVTNGESTAGISISITDQGGTTTTKSGTINMTGLVKFTDLSTTGSTEINGANIQTGTITATQISAKTITAGEIADSTITNAKIADATITGAKLVDATITGAKIAASTITNAKIANSTITGAKIAANTITSGKIAAGAITADMITAGTMSADRISGGSIDATNVTINNIDASKITSGTISAARIDTDSLYVSKIYSPNDNTNPRIECYDKTTTPTRQEIYIGGRTSSGAVDIVQVSASTRVKICSWGLSTTYFDFDLSNTTAPVFRYSSQNVAHLGDKDHYWKSAYIGYTETHIGQSSSSKLGFFGATATARQTLSLTSNNMGYTSVTSSNYLYALNNLIGILKSKYGLIS